MSKSLQRGILFSICVALILAIALTLAFFAGGGDKNILSAPEGQVSATAGEAKNDVTYTHGSDIGRTISGEVDEVYNKEQFLTAVENNRSMKIMNSFELDSDPNPGASQVFRAGRANREYSGTIYGQGYTISFKGIHETRKQYSASWSYNGQSGNFNGWSIGGLVNTLTGNGAIYDLNVVMKSGSAAIGANNDSNVYMGVFAGTLEGSAKVENCTLTVNGGGRLMVARGNQGGISQTSEAWLGVGGIAGRINSTGVVVKNVTVSMDNILIEGGQTKNSGVNTDGYHAITGMVIGMISTNAKIDNIRILGSFGTYGSHEAKVGVAAGSGVEMRTTVNVYDDVTTTTGKNPDNVKLIYASETGNAYVTNIYKSSTSDNTWGTNVGDHEIYFDPMESESGNSLAIGFTGQPAIPSGYKRTYTLTSAKNTQYTNQDNFVVSNNGATVVAKGLPSATSNWNSNGAFTANLTYKDTLKFEIPKDLIPFYEHGYVEESYVPTGKAISSGEQFTALFRPNGTVDQSGSYYLTQDIAISGFTGNTFNGTLDGDGHTIYIIDKNQDTYTGPNVGGLVGSLGSGTIKNLRVVYVNSLEISLTGKPGRVGLVAGKVDGGTVQNVQVVVQQGVEISAGNTNDNEFAMGGVVGEAAGNAQIKDVTLDHNGTLDPTGQWQFLAGIAGVIKSANTSGTGLSATFTDVAMRGAGTLAGNALNSGQPTFTGAFAVLMPENKANPAVTFVEADGLIYDFDVTLDGTVQTQGNSNGKYSCYYLFTYNYNDNPSYNDEENGGQQSGSPIEAYNTAVEYSNVFIASDYVQEMAGFAGFRTNGNAAVGGATVLTVQNKVSGRSDSDVTAYFDPVDKTNTDMIFRATGSWGQGDMVQLYASDNTRYQSIMEEQGNYASAKLIFAPKATAATDGEVQLVMFEHVNTPADLAPLTYNGAEQQYPFELTTTSGTKVDETQFDVVYSVEEGDTGTLGENSLPLTAGTYTATITLVNMEFIADGQGTGSRSTQVTVTVDPFKLEIDPDFVWNGIYGEYALGENGVITADDLTAANLFTNEETVSGGANVTPAITVALTGGGVPTASTAGKLPVGGYVISSFTVDDPNFTVDPGTLSFDVSKKGITAQITIGRTLPDSFTGMEFDLVDGDFTPAFTTAESGDVITLEYLINDGALADTPIYDAGAYVFTAQIAAGGDGDNYTLTSYTFGSLTDNTHNVSKYTVTGSWAFADGAALVYGTPVSDPSVLITTDFSANTVTVDEHVVSVSVSLETASASWTENLPAGTAVNVVVNVELANDTNFILGTISAPDNAQLTVQKKALSVTDVTTPDAPYFPLMSVEYGSEEINSDEALTAAFNAQYARYINGIYGSDQLEFAVQLYLGEAADDGNIIAGSTPVTWSDLNAYTSYVAVVTLADADGNYVMDQEADHFIFGVTPKEVIVTGVTLDGFDGDYIYDGKDHKVVINIGTQLVGDDTVADILTADVLSVKDAKTYTITVSAIVSEEDWTAANNYAFKFENGTGDSSNEYSVEVQKRTLTLAEGLTYTFLTEKSTVIEALKSGMVTGFVEGDGAGYGWAWTSALAETVLGGETYLNAGNYEASVTITGGAAATNYVKPTENITVTINAFDLSGAVMTVGALTYNGEEQIAPVVVTANGVDVTSLLTVSGNTATAAGSNYTAKAEAKDGNFTGSKEKSFTVAQKQLKLERLTLSSVTYTGKAITVAGHTFAAGFEPAGDEKPVLVIAVQGDGVEVKNAGEYTFNVSLAADNEVNKNYAMAEGAGTMTATVDPASVIVTAGKEAEFGVDFGESARADTSRFYESDFITLSAQPDETFTLSSALTFIVTNSETQEEVRSAEGSYTLAPGTYTVTYTINDIEGANYTLTADGELTTTLTVEEGARKLAIERWDNTTLTYNGSAQKPTPVFADSAEIGPLPEGALVYEVTAKEGSTLTDENAVNAGAYTVTVSIAPDFAEQYELAGDKLSTDFTIEKLEVVLKWEAVGDLVYNGKEHTATATVGNKQGDDVVEVIAGLVNGNDNKNVGEFFFEATGLTGADADNYSLPAKKQHAFNVTPAQVKLTWNFKENATIVYGDGVEAVKALVDIAALNGKIPGAEAPLTFEVSVGDYSATTGAGTEVTYDVSYTLPDGALEKNYHITLEAAEGKDKLTVGKAVLNLVEADTASLTKVYDGAAVTLDSLLTADNVVVKGMKNGENAFDLKILRISASQQEMTNAAVYDGIVIEIIKDCNYIAADLKIIYTITPKLIGVGWSNTQLTYNGAAQAPTATATGLVGAESLTLNVSGAQTDANAEGQPYTATVTAESVTGNYKLENDATVEFTIARKSVNVAWSNKELTYNGSEQAPTAKIAEDGLIGEDEVILTVSGAQTNANTSGSYTATAAITGGADMGNYVLDESSASTAFTITPKSVSVTLTADGGDTVDFDVAGSVKAGAWTADGNNKATLTLSDGATTVTLTAEAQEALPLIEGAPALVLLLDNAVYEGTPYGTKVQGGKLTVISADTNYVFEVAQKVTVNITPAITVGLKAGVKTTVALEVVLGPTYNAEYFKNNYFQVTGKDGAEVTGGTLEVTITPSEGLEEGAIKHAGAYTVKAKYTPAGAQAGAELPNYSFTFTVTPVEVTSVTYIGEAFTYGALGASGEITVTVEYADGTRAENVTAKYVSENVSTGGWLKAGSTQVTVNYAGENGDYAAVDHDVTLSIEKLDITATLTCAEQSGTSLTLPYKGRKGYSVGAELRGIKDGDRVSARADGDFVDVQENIPATIMLDGDDKDNYNVTENYSVTITPAPLNITVEAAESTYTGQPIVLNVKAGEGEIFADDEVTFTVSGEGVENNAVTNAGTYELTVATAGAQGGNYTIVDPSASVEIAKADVTIVWSEQTEFVYSGVAVVPSADVQFKGESVGTATVTCDGDFITEGKAIDVGHYTAVAVFAGTANFNEVINGSFSFNITPAQLNITVEAAESTYTGQPIALIVKAGEGEIFAEDEVTFTVSGEGVENNAVTNAGAYELTVATAGAQGGNYTIVDPSASVEIAKANVTIVWGEQREFVYSGTAVVPSADVQFNDESVGTATVTCAGDNLEEGQAINVGNYTATAVFAGDDNFNAASDDSFAFEITKATLTVTPEKDSFSEHDADKMAAYAKDAFAITIAGLVTVTGVEADGAISDFTVEEQAVNYQTEGEHKGAWLAVGKHTYSVTAESGNSDNYESFTFTVEVTAQEMITITATPDRTVYTGSEIGFTYAVKDDAEFDMTGVTVEIASVEVTLASAETVTTDVVKDAGTYKVTFTVTAQDDTYYYVVTPWKGKIEQAPVSVQQAAGVYGQIVLNANGTISGTFTTPFVVFNGQPVDVIITYDGAAAGAALLAEGDSILAAGTYYDASVSLNDYNFKWEDEASYKQSTLVVEKKTVKLDYTPSSTSFSASGISFTLEDHTAAQVGEDSLTVQIVIDGVPVDPLDPPVLNAGTHTVTYLIGGSGKENYDFKPVEETFTLAARKLDPEITVDGQDEISNGGTLNMTVGEQRNIMSAINGYLERNSVPASDRTITVSGGKDLAAVSTWEPGTYTVTVAFSGNHAGSMTFTVTVSEQAPLPEIPDAPVLPETPLTEAEDGGAGWLFPLLIAIVALIDVALVVAIIIVAKKRA